MLWKMFVILIALEVAWGAQLVALNGDLMVTPVIVRVLWGLGLGEMSFRSSRWGVAFGRLWWVGAFVFVVVDDATV